MQGFVNFITAEMADAVSKSTGGTFEGEVVVDQSTSSATSTESKLTIGNDIADGTAGSSYGSVRIFGKGTKRVRILADSVTGNRDIQLPNNSGTIALTGDLPTDFVSASAGGTFNGSITIDKQNGTTSAIGTTELAVGNNKGSGVAKNSRGFFYLYSNAGKWCCLRNDNGTANRSIYFPDKGGTIALTSDANWKSIDFTYNSSSSSTNKRVYDVTVTDMFAYHDICVIIGVHSYNTVEFCHIVPIFNGVNPASLVGGKDENGYDWYGKFSVVPGTKTITVYTSTNSHIPATYYLELTGICMR